MITCLNSSGKVELFYDSSVIYRDNNGNCIRMAGRFFQNETNNYLTKINDKKFEYITTLGDKCGDSFYYTKYNFINSDKKEEKNVEYNNLKAPSDITDCSIDINIHINFQESTEYLLIQKFLNDYWIATGIIFLIIGIYLMFLAQNKKATKILISIIFGEIFTFTNACCLFGLKGRYMEWILLSLGIIIGIIIGYFCLKGRNRIYKTILAINAGLIFGIIIFDFIFCHQNYMLAEILFTDSVLIFIGLTIVTVFLVPEYHYLCDSIIGSYLFIRGISVLMQKLGKYVRFRELQLLLYFLNRYELPYPNYLYKNFWPFYFVYDIFIVIFIGVSMFYYIIKVVGKDEENDEIDEELEKNLIGDDKSTSINANDEEIE